MEACRDDAARCGYDEDKSDDSLDLYFGPKACSASTAPLPPVRHGTWTLSDVEQI
jgi:hypothetical protein